MFPSQNGDHLTAGVVTKILSDVLGAAKAHRLRHRRATRAYAAERDLLAVQRLPGHSKPETIARCGCRRRCFTTGCYCGSCG